MNNNKTIKVVIFVLAFVLILITFYVFQQSGKVNVAYFPNQKLSTMLNPFTPTNSSQYVFVSQVSGIKSKVNLEELENTITKAWELSSNNNFKTLEGETTGIIVTLVDKPLPGVDTEVTYVIDGQDTLMLQVHKTSIDRKLHLNIRLSEYLLSSSEEDLNFHINTSLLKYVYFEKGISMEKASEIAMQEAYTLKKAAQEGKAKWPLQITKS